MTKKCRALVLSLPAIFLLTAAGADEKPFNAGFIAVPSTSETPPIGIWYPSTSIETAGELGPFRVVLAWGGEVAGGRFPVIVLSHGRGGRYRNHWQTAAGLAQNGYIVAAPDHLPDREMTSLREIVPVVTRRIEELKLTLSAVANHPVLAPVAATDRIGAVGYSLGTMTALYAAGATPRITRFRAHCEANHRQDAELCGGGWAASFLGIVKSVLRYLREKGILKPRDKKPRAGQIEFADIDKPMDFTAIALIAPVGVPFSAEDVRRIPARIALFRLGDDAQLRYPYHAEYLRRILSAKNPVHKNFPGVHHNAFISPFPKWLVEQEDIPVAKDPEGFDRAGFIREINADIVRFFQNHL